MAKYLISGTYSPAGAKGLASEGGSSRKETIERMVGALDGSVECFYYALGSDDVHVICDLPDATSVAAISLAVNSTGAVSIKTTPLLSVEEIDEAAKKAVEYRPPGQ